MKITVVRSRRRTLVLSVNRSGEAIVRAPLQTREEDIEKFVARHRRWLARRIEERNQSLPDFANGSRIEILGKEMTVATGKARLENGVLYLPEEGRSETLIRLCKSLARARMEALTRELAQRYGFSYAGVRIGSARGRWGSCNSRGGICYTFRTAFLPDGLAEYIVVHELCHTRHFNHSAAFWREVEKVLPDYSARRRALKGYLWAMNCL